MYAHTTINHWIESGCEPPPSGFVLLFELSVAGERSPTNKNSIELVVETEVNIKCLLYQLFLDYRRFHCARVLSGLSDPLNAHAHRPGSGTVYREEGIPGMSFSALLRPVESAGIGAFNTKQ